MYRNRAKSQAIFMLKNRNEYRAHIYDEDTLRNIWAERAVKDISGRTEFIQTRVIRGEAIILVSCAATLD